MAKTEAASHLGELTRVVRETALRKALPDEDVRREQVPKRINVDRVIQRERKKSRPADPNDVHDALDLEWIKANAPGIGVIGKINTDTRILMFSTDQQLRTLMSADLWLCDGTFKV